MECNSYVQYHLKKIYLTNRKDPDSDNHSVNLDVMTVEKWLDTPQSSKTGALPLDDLWCHS